MLLNASHENGNSFSKSFCCISRNYSLYFRIMKSLQTESTSSKSTIRHNGYCDFSAFIHFRISFNDFRLTVCLSEQGILPLTTVTHHCTRDFQHCQLAVHFQQRSKDAFFMITVVAIILCPLPEL